MTKRLLVDATHAEEMRVAVVENNHLVDFDYESILRKQLKGSIFLAKVTRVEPSLQAAFVNFGGNRHGFLPFSEIHPDYFRIPIADREALLEEQKAAMEALAAAEEAEDEEEEAAAKADDAEEDFEEAAAVDDADEETSEDDADAEEDSDESENGETEDEAAASEGPKARHRRGRGRRGRRGRRGQPMRSRAVEIVGGDMAEGEQTVRPTLKKNYKIQEVVKRGQIMLVQAQKEERGNKGAAVTTYLSLPGRYCVLMPNSPRGGGVSRKIANFSERKRMREILKELAVPDGMSVILRTAGTERTKAEIKRDLDYLMRLWDEIRDLTLKSIAPSCVYEEGSLVKRALRDIYTRDISEVIVSGEDAYKEAKKIMKMLMPSHVKKVKEFVTETTPLFQKYNVEKQIAEISEPTATLKSGGYIVINPTEALVAVDVNSGRATKERHIEETALRTNLEAASEVARQLKLRDLGGLIVIDFIDMEDYRNNQKVEKRLKDALSGDRARIQIGRISNFGLLELSRQRLNPSVTESQFKLCDHCQGFGYTRTTDSAAVIALRAVEERAISSKGRDNLTVSMPNAVALYILNHKRPMLATIEQRHGIQVSIEVNEELAPAGYEITSNGPSKAPSDAESDDASAETEAEETNADSSDESDDGNTNNNNNDRRNRRTRRGRRGGRNRGDKNNNRQNDDSNENSQPQDKAEKAEAPETNEDKSEEKPKSKGRGGRKPAAKKDEKSEGDASDKSDDKSAKSDQETASEEKPKAKPRTRKASTAKKDEVKDSQDESSDKAEKAEKKEPKKKSEKSKKAANDEKKSKAEEQAAKDYEVVNEAPEKKKRGWWSKNA